LNIAAYCGDTGLITVGIARKNLLLTTIEKFSADFLLQHTDAWKAAIQVTCKGMQTQEEQI
jgi:hypothetical protein